MTSIFIVMCFVVANEVHCFERNMPDMDTCVEARKTFSPGKTAGFAYCVYKRK